MLFFLAACGGEQTTAKPAPAPAASDNGLLAELADASSSPGFAADDAGSDAVDASAVASPTTSSTTTSSAPDPCTKPSTDFEAKVRVKFNDCYQAGKKKNPDLAGEIRVTLNTDYKGKITSVKSTGPDDLGAAVIRCMVDAVKKTPFEHVDACPSKAILVGKKFGK